MERLEKRLEPYISELRRRGLPEWEVIHGRKHPKLVFPLNGRTISYTVADKPNGAGHQTNSLSRFRKLLKDVPLVDRSPKPRSTKTEDKSVMPKNNTELYNLGDLRIGVTTSGHLSLIFSPELMSNLKHKRLEECWASDGHRLRVRLSDNGHYKLSKQTGSRPEKVGCRANVHRSRVGFQYTTERTHGKTTPKLSMRLVSKTANETVLESNERIPEIIRRTTVEKPEQDEKTSQSNGAYTLQDGIELKKMLNDWLVWAEGEGLSPILEVEDGRVNIRVSRSL